jgi:hypothetical protein
MVVLQEEVLVVVTTAVGHAGYFMRAGRAAGDHLVVVAAEDFLDRKCEPQRQNI